MFLEEEFFGECDMYLQEFGMVTKQWLFLGSRVNAEDQSLAAWAGHGKVRMEHPSLPQHSMGEPRDLPVSELTGFSASGTLPLRLLDLWRDASSIE